MKQDITRQGDDSSLVQLLDDMELNLESMFPGIPTKNIEVVEWNRVILRFSQGNSEHGEEKPNEQLPALEQTPEPETPPTLSSEPEPAEVADKSVNDESEDVVSNAQRIGNFVGNTTTKALSAISVMVSAPFRWGTDVMAARAARIAKQAEQAPLTEKAEPATTNPAGGITISRRALLKAGGVFVVGVPAIWATSTLLSKTEKSTGTLKGSSLKPDLDFKIEVSEKKMFPTFTFNESGTYTISIAEGKGKPHRLGSRKIKDLVDEEKEGSKPSVVFGEKAGRENGSESFERPGEPIKLDEVDIRSEQLMPLTVTITATIGDYIYELNFPFTSKNFEGPEVTVTPQKKLAPAPPAQKQKKEIDKEAKEEDATQSVEDSK